MANFIKTKENQPIIINPSESIRGGNWTGAKGFIGQDQRAVSGLVSGFPLINEGSFGGDGSDGHLLITSGTTTLDLGASTILTKHYKSLSIIGTGVLAFTNKATGGALVILKVKGDVHITSSSTAIDLSGFGGDGGDGGAITPTDGTDGDNTGYILDSVNHFGGGGEKSGASGTAGTAGAVTELKALYPNDSDKLPRRFTSLFIGSGGGGGGGGNITAAHVGGDGGAGGGALYIECGGKLIFTSTISVAGVAGSAGGGVDGNPRGAGGGGGAGGSCVILANTLKTNSGTITISGGGAGAGGGVFTTGTMGAGGGGGGGGYNAGNAGGTGTNNNSPAGGGGATGFSLVALNTTFQ